MDVQFRFTRPVLPPAPEWVPHLEPAYRESWFSNHGPVARLLEQRLASQWVPAGREPVLVASATAGLVAALIAADVEGRVAIPSFTFPATAHAVRLAGCIPVLCDVDEDTWELDPQDVATAVHDHGCQAIIHVRAFGLCRDLSPLEEIARAAGIPLIVDAAAAFGGRLDSGVPAGGAGDMEVFSFHATKAFAMGEGGVVQAPAATADRLRQVINFSLEGTDVIGRGLNGKLSEFSAAVGIATLDRFEDQLAARAAAVEYLLRTVSAEGGAKGPARPGKPPWQCLPLALQAVGRRDSAIEELRRRGIEARPYYSPGLHQTRAFRALATRSLPVTESLVDRILCLPVYSNFSEAELQTIASAAHEVLVEQLIGPAS